MSNASPGLPAAFAETAVISFEEPESVILPTDVFSLHYRKGNDILFLNFHFPRVAPETTAREQFRLAVDRARLHCEKMRYRFIFCRPYVTDLSEEEKRMPL